MNEDFIFRLGADVSSFTKSITEVEKELDSARKAIKGALGDDLVKGNQYVEQLEQSLKDLKSTGVQVPGAAKAATEIKNISPAAQKAQNTLTGLSGVVRDLPFGFIAIQNNLPILADQFGALSKESGGIKNALKQFGGALAGPAGIAFAVGAVISSITALVQKYGSLSSAISEVLVLQKSQKDLQNELSTSIGKTVGEAQAEITTLNNLTNILTNTNSTLNQRNGAYEELNQKYPGLLSNLSQEEIASGKVNTVIAGRIALFAKEIELNGKRKALEGLIAKEAEKSFTSLSKLANASFLDALVMELEGVLLGFNAGTAGLQVFAQQTQNGAKATQFFEGVLKGVQGELSETEGAIKTLTDAEKKRKEEEKKAAEEAAKRAAKAKADQEKKIAQQKALNAAIERETEARMKANTEANKRAAAVKAQQLESLALKNRTAELKKVAQAEKEALTAFQQRQQAEMTFGLETMPVLPGFKNLAPKLVKEINTQAGLDILENTFFNPIQGLFTDLISGADNAFKSFAKAVLSAINQIVAKIIATGIIKLLAMLASPGGFAGAGGFKELIKGVGSAFGFKFEANTFKNAFDFAGIANGLQNAINSVNTSFAFQGSLAGVSNPNFGGVTGGGMAMSGAVNVVLRGQDLVGSLNRTNAQINRVG